MSGLEKIVGQILDDAGKEAEEILKKAKAEAEAIVAGAKEDAEKMEAEAKAAAEKRKKDQMDRVKSSAELKKRQAVLQAKQQLISEMLEKAYEDVISRADDEYFGILAKMLDRFVLAKKGEIYFSQKDLERMPGGFEAVIQKAAKAKGGSLTLMEEPKKIDGGFVLVYGGVEENCTFRALFAEKKDELSDKVHAMLFS